MADAHGIPCTKACKKCGVEKPLHPDFFEPQALGKYGFTARCRDCRSGEQASLRSRQDQKERQQAWRDANKEKVKAYNEAYRSAGYKSTQDAAKWRAANIDRARVRDALYMRQRRAQDPAFRLLCRLRARLSLMIGGKAGRRTESLLGFTMEELRLHIERQFTDGMSWEAVKTGDVEIDHIIPVAAFRITKLEDPDFKACWGLPNLRPAWKSDNRAKGRKVLTLL